MDKDIKLYFLDFSFNHLRTDGRLDEHIDRWTKIEKALF